MENFWQPSFVRGKEGNHPNLKNGAAQTARSDKVEYVLLEVSWESPPQDSKSTLLKWIDIFRQVKGTDRESHWPTPVPSSLHHTCWKPFQSVSFVSLPQEGTEIRYHISISKQKWCKMCFAVLKKKYISEKLRHDLSWLFDTKGGLEIVIS